MSKCHVGVEKALGTVLNARNPEKRVGTLRWGLFVPVSFFWNGGVMSLGIYLVGFLLVIAGLIYGAVLMHIATHWIVVGAVVLTGLGLLKGVQATRGKDSSS